MGCVASVELIWGIPIDAYDEDGEPTQFWNEEEGDWIDFAKVLAKRDGAVNPWESIPPEINYGSDEQFEAWKATQPDWQGSVRAWDEAIDKAKRCIDIEIRTYGHYNDPESRAILGSPRIEPIEGDAWTPKAVTRDDLINECVSDKAYSKANDSARLFGLDVNFYTDAAWWLVASYG